MARKPKRRLTPRQNRFIKALAKGKTQGQAAVEAGYSPKNAGQLGNQLITRLRGSMPEVLEKHGLTDDSLIENYLIPLLKARRVKYFQHNGKVKDRRTVEALEIRHSALDTAFKLKGSYAPLQMEQATRTVTTIILDVPRPPRPGNGAKPIDVEPTSSKGNGTGQD
jgi:hypothetical protein